MRALTAALALVLLASTASADTYGLPATCALIDSGGEPSEVVDLGDEHFYLDEITLIVPGAFCLILPRSGENVILACNDQVNGKGEEAASIFRGDDMATISFPDGTGIALVRC